MSALIVIAIYFIIIGLILKWAIRIYQAATLYIQLNSHKLYDEEPKP